MARHTRIFVLGQIIQSPCIPFSIRPVYTIESAFKQGAENERRRVMSEQKQNRTKEAAECTAEFAMPAFCGPMIARMMKACGPPSTEHGDTKAEADGAGAPSCCESMMARMREVCSESSKPKGGESSSDEKGPGCCS